MEGNLVYPVLKILAFFRLLLDLSRSTEEKLVVRVENAEEEAWHFGVHFNSDLVDVEVEDAFADEDAFFIF